MRKIQSFIFLGLCGMAWWPLACGKNLSPTSASGATPTPAPDWTISSSVTIEAGSYNYGNIHIKNGGVLNLMGPSGAVTGAAVTLDLTGTFVMDAGASVVGIATGYGPGQGPGAGGVFAANIGGGGHGGAGGVGGSASAGPANDDSVGPTLMGSGGGGANSGAGGALLRINATSATLNGSILVDGNTVPAGGGAGGTIFIQANTIFGNGLLEAAGGGSITPNTGGGGGGLITLSVHSGYYFTGTTNVSGASGVGTNSTGGNGFFSQTGY